MQSIFEKKTQLIYLSLLVSLSLCAFFPVHCGCYLEFISSISFCIFFTLCPCSAKKSLRTNKEI